VRKPVREVADETTQKILLVDSVKPLPKPKHRLRRFLLRLLRRDH
jgi:hypothetical protein